jgi:hypothetical protein
VTFTRATISWRRTAQGVTWSGTAAGTEQHDAPVVDGDEVRLLATTIDGRSVEGRAVISPATDADLLAFVGTGSLLVEGREL